MKKLATVLMVLFLLGATQQKAAAWCRCNFSCGLNLCCEKADTSCLWGLFKSGPAPCDMGYPHMDSGYGCAGYGYPDFASRFQTPVSPAPTALAAKPAQATPNAMQPVGYYPNYTPAYGYQAPYAYYPQWPGYYGR
jgi:hypothetical protein